MHDVGLSSRQRQGMGMVPSLHQSRPQLAAAWDQRPALQGAWHLTPHLLAEEHSNSCMAGPTALEADHPDLLHWPPKLLAYRGELES